MKKKLVLLGGIRYLLPVIEAAHKIGECVIMADYLPGKIAKNVFGAVKQCER